MTNKPLKMKKCIWCKTIKPLSEFYKRKGSLDGLYYWCKTCNCEYIRKRRNENIEEARKNERKWQMENREGKTRAWNKWAKEQRKANPTFRLNSSIRSAIWDALRFKKKGRKWEKLVGYSLEDLIKHLEKQFDNKMTWDNYGWYWEVDHIKPKSWFSYLSYEDEEFKKCWALGNLQPLKKDINREKSNYYVG